jgi:hypothetical protein
VDVWISADPASLIVIPFSEGDGIEFRRRQECSQGEGSPHHVTFSEGSLLRPFAISQYCPGGEPASWTILV